MNKTSVSEETKIALKSMNGFVANRPNIMMIVGSHLDEAQYIALVSKENYEQTTKANEKIGLGNILTPTGRRYPISVNGIPGITNHKGETISKAYELGEILKSGNGENELHYDSMAYLEVEGSTPNGKKFIGIFYSIADAVKHVTEEAEKGEL
jgi:hypothetical protein